MNNIPDTIEFDVEGKPKISVEAQKRIDDYVKDLQSKLGPLQSNIPNIPHVAPMWIIFPEHIINTNNIVSIRKFKYQDKSGIIEIELCEKVARTSNTIQINVPDLDKTWYGLCEIFAGHE